MDSLISALVASELENHSTCHIQRQRVFLRTFSNALNLFQHPATGFEFQALDISTWLPLESGSNLLEAVSANDLCNRKNEGR